MKKYIFILLAAMAFVACSEDEENELIGPVTEASADEIPLNVKAFFNDYVSENYEERQGIFLKGKRKVCQKLQVRIVCTIFATYSCSIALRKRSAITAGMQTYLLDSRTITTVLATSEHGILGCPVMGADFPYFYVVCGEPCGVWRRSAPLLYTNIKLTNNMKNYFSRYLSPFVAYIICNKGSQIQLL